MDTFLTLVIAIGGIAAGVGAIWAAMLARRHFFFFFFFFFFF